MKRLAVALVLLAAGCGGSETAREACEPGGTAPATGTGAAADVAYLTAVAVEAGACGDEVRFAFRDGAPAYRVEYLPAERALVEDGSGNRLEADGEAFLVVRLEPAATAEAAADGSLDVTYAGPKRLRPDGAEAVREVVKSGDFEAVVTWVVALDEPRPFSVSAGEGTVAVRLSR